MTEIERPWIDALAVSRPSEVRDALVAAGTSVSTAASVVLWLYDQQARRRLVSDETARIYRRLLERASAPKPPSKLRAIPGYRNLSTPRAA